MSTDHISPLVAAVRARPFDLVARANLALEGCASLLNAELEGQPYSYIELHTAPPVAMHAPLDYGDSAGHLLEALTFARIMTGTAPDERDALLAGHLLAHQREDGLISVPATPWTRPLPIVELEWTQRGALMAWTTRYLAFDDAEALNAAQKLVQALYKTVIWEKDMCWLPASVLPAGGWLDRRPPIDRPGDILTGAQIVFPLVRFAVATGNDQAHRLAAGLIRFFRQRSGAFDREGHITDKGARYLHSTAGLLKAALRFAIHLADVNSIEWVQSCYAELRAYGTDFGFFPHRVAGADRWQGDTTFLKDMIELAILLGSYRDHTYFRDAERFGRNHLLESQILELDWVEKEIDVEFPQVVWCANHPPEGVRTEGVPQAVRGHFASWSLCNDAIDPTNPRLMLRSTAAGIRALYDLWHYAIAREDEAVRVNMLFSRDTRWANVTCRVPHEGFVEVLMKTRGVLAVRIPDETDNEDLVTVVNGTRHREEVLRGGYGWLQALRNGDVATYDWSQKERKEVCTLNDKEYNLKWRGDSVVDIDPAGTLNPIYKRDKVGEPAPANTVHGVGKEIDPL